MRAACATAVSDVSAGAPPIHLLTFLYCKVVTDEKITGRSDGWSVSALRLFLLLCCVAIFAAAAPGDLREDGPRGDAWIPPSADVAASAHVAETETGAVAAQAHAGESAASAEGVLAGVPSAPEAGQPSRVLSAMSWFADAVRTPKVQDATYALMSAKIEVPIPAVPIVVLGGQFNFDRTTNRPVNREEEEKAGGQQVVLEGQMQGSIGLSLKVAKVNVHISGYAMVNARVPNAFMFQASIATKSLLLHAVEENADEVKRVIDGALSGVEDAYNGIAEALPRASAAELVGEYAAKFEQTYVTWAAAQRRTFGALHKRMRGESSLLRRMFDDEDSSPLHRVLAKACKRAMASGDVDKCLDVLGSDVLDDYEALRQRVFLRAGWHATYLRGDVVAELRSMHGELVRLAATLKGVSAETLATRAAKRVRTKAFAAIDKMVAFAVAMRKKDDVKVAYTTSLSVGLQVAVDTVRGPSGSLSFEIGTGKTGVILPPGQADAEWSADWVGPTVRFTASVRKVDVEVTVRIMDYNDSHGKPGDADFVPKRLSYVNVRVLLPNDMGMRKVALTAMVLRSAALKSLVESIVTESYRLFSGSSASPTADKEAVSKYAFWETFLQDLIVMVETSGAFSIAPKFVKSRLGIVARVLIFNTDDGRTLLDQRQTTVMPFIVADIFGAVTDKSEFRLGSGTKLDLAVGGGFTVPLATFLSAETARKEGIAVVPEPIAKLHK